MTLLDGAILVVLLVSVGFGVSRGFVREVLGLAGLVAGVVVAGLYAAAVAAPLERWLPPTAARAVAFAGLLFGVLLVAALIGHLLTKMLEAVKLSLPNRLLGGVFGLARGALLVVALLAAVDLLGVDPRPWVDGSRLGGPAWRAAREFRTRLPLGRSLPEPLPAGTPTETI
jgi:membrane protein required for colicin V production